MAMAWPAAGIPMARAPIQSCPAYHVQLAELQRRCSALEVEAAATRDVERERQLQVARLHQALDLRAAELMAETGQQEEEEGLTGRLMYALSGRSPSMPAPGRWGVCVCGGG